MLLRRYVNESEVKLHDLLLEDVDDLIEQARRQRDALFVDPGGVHDGGDHHRGRIVVPKTSTLSFCPCKGLLVDFEDVRCELDLLRLQDAVPIEVQGVVAFLCRDGYLA